MPRYRHSYVSHALFLEKQNAWVETNFTQCQGSGDPQLFQIISSNVATSKLACMNSYLLTYYLVAEILRITIHRELVEKVIKESSAWIAKLDIREQARTTTALYVQTSNSTS